MQKLNIPNIRKTIKKKKLKINQNEKTRTN